MYKKILITGAKGMLGSALCRALEFSYNVTGIDKEVDITDNKAVIKAVKGLNVDAVVHCAACADVDGAEDEPKKATLVNTEGTKNILDSLRNQNPIFIYISTDYIFDGRKQTAYLETDAPNPLGMYGKSKLEAEVVLSNFGKRLIVRTSWLFGPNGKNFVDTIIRLGQERKTLEIVDDQIGSPTYTVDLSRAIKDILDIYFYKGLEFGIYNVTNSGQCSWFELAKDIVNLAKINVKIEPISSQVLKRKAKRPQNSLLSNEKFHSLTGYYLPSWQEAVRNYLKINDKLQNPNNKSI